VPIYSNDGRLIETQPPPATGTGSKVKKALGPIAGIGILIAKFFVKLKFIILPLLKFLPLILKTGGTMLLSIGVYAMIFGWQFAAGFVLLIFVHECGHLIMAKKFGLKVSAPVFIPFVGAAIMLKEQPQNAWVEACIGIGGPFLGALGALACNGIGEAFNAPLFIALASSGYFLNLFNLLPVGMLDGGRIVTAMSRWLWLPGLALLVWFGWASSSILVWIIVIISLPRVLSLFRKRTEEEKRYFEVTTTQRLVMSVLYFGLITMLAVGQYVAHNELADRGLVRHARHQTRPVVQ
jgi:Zn-dependent protease